MKIAPDCTYSIGQLVISNRSYPARMKHKHLISEIPDIVVYVVKCHEKVLYVGMTGIGVINRLRNHLGSNSPLGKAIKENKPFSDDWMVDLYGMRDRASAYNIESQLAHSLSPALNR